MHELSLLTIEERREGEPGVATQTLSFARDVVGTASASMPALARELARLPGAIVQEGFGAIDPPRITLRGSGLQSAPVNRGVLWFLDGLPLNATDGSFTSACIDLSFMQSIRVSPGSSDPLAAGTALGGRIDLDSRPGPPGCRVWTAAGGDGLWSAGASAAGSFTKQTQPTGPEPAEDDTAPRAWSAVSGSGSDGWRRRSGQDRVSWNAGYAAPLGEDGPALHIGLLAVRPRFDVPGPLTLDVARATPGEISSVVLADRPRRETEFAHVGINLDWSCDAQASTRLALGAQHTDDWFRQLRANGISATAGSDFTALAEARRQAGDHTLAGGLIARQGMRQQERWINVEGTAGRRFADLNLKAVHLVAWLDDRWALAESFAIEGGVSVSRDSRQATGDPAGGAGSMSTTEAAPHLGLAWTPARDSIIRFRCTRGAEAATFDDLLATRGGPAVLNLDWTPLRNQRSDTLELAAAGKAGAWAWSCTVYHARWENELLRLADEAGSPRGTVNAPPTEHSGAEAAARWRVLAGHSGTLDLEINHTWSRAKFRHDPVHGGRHIGGLPPHAGSARLTWSHPRGLSANLGARWIGGTTWVDHANRLGYGGDGVVDVQVAWQWLDGWVLFAGVDNVFDRSTIASTAGVIDMARNPGSTALFLPGAPRQLRLGLSWSR